MRFGCVGTSSSLLTLVVVGCGATADPLDSDGDALPDDWELQGVDVDGNGTVDLDLPALGADAFHKDVFVEVDWMEVPGPEGHSDAYLLGALERVRQAFLAAPVDNPDGQTGIVLHVDAGPESVLDPRTSRRWGADSGGRRHRARNGRDAGARGGPSSREPGLRAPSRVPLRGGGPQLRADSEPACVSRSRSSRLARPPWAAHISSQPRALPQPPR